MKDILNGKLQHILEIHEDRGGHYQNYIQH